MKRNRLAKLIAVLAALLTAAVLFTVSAFAADLASDLGTAISSDIGQQIASDLTDKAKDLLAQKGFDPLLGARPLRRVIQRDIEDAVSEKILMGELNDNERVIVDADGEGILGEFTFRSEPFELPAAGEGDPSKDVVEENAIPQPVQ